MEKIRSFGKNKELKYDANLKTFMYRYNIKCLEGEPFSENELKEVFKVRGIMGINATTGVYREKLEENILYTMIAKVYSKVGYIEGFILQTEYGTLVRVNYMTLSNYIHYGGRVLGVKLCADGRLSIIPSVKIIIKED